MLFADDRGVGERNVLLSRRFPGGSLKWTPFLGPRVKLENGRSVW
jgi:hypothetical protein